MDRMRLDIFHKDNPKGREERMADFEKLLATEPYKTAVETFDLSRDDKRWWMLPMEYARRRNFGMLDFCFAHPKLFHYIGQIKIRLAGRFGRKSAKSGEST